MAYFGRWDFSHPLLHIHCPIFVVVVVEKAKLNRCALMEQ